MQNEAHTSFVSNFAKKITLKNRACHDLCNLSKINRNTEFISGRMRIISNVSLAILFFYQFIQCIKCSEGLQNRNFPFRECTNYTLDIKEQNYAIYAINAVTSRCVLALTRRRPQNVLNLTTTAYIHTLSVRKQTA